MWMFEDLSLGLVLGYLKMSFLCICLFDCLSIGLYIICMIKNVYFFVQSLNQLLGPIDRKAQKCKQETKTI